MSNDNGGSAFPINKITYPNGEVDYGSEGMSLRDYFAAKAMQAIIIADNGGLVEVSKKSGMDAAKFLARIAYAQADYMLKARGGDK